MFYFKKIILTEYTHSQLENGLRKVALKRTRPLDFDISSMDIGTDKFFFGYEGKKGLYFTRIRTSFERLIPKLIIRLSRDKGACYYEIRLGAFSALWFVFYSLFILMLLISLSIGEADTGGAVPVLIMLLSYGALFYLEFRLTISRVERAVRKYTETNISMAQ